uniref:Protein kinase domain-containing protein n=1 Tax=Eucampia antarctica TaxID=49252 RepID=A0A7S2VYH5_9STRA|mmetsp:Transcript_1051/g.968  ORF Transcript_1051/g.968 Transcript_1051/m.968 type:complete len:199 (+) Transcript_1051:2-598(+)
MKGSKKKNHWMDRVMVACDIAGALGFIHSMNVIYRDLKPDNIGFDVRGDVKLFDFGLAKELTALNKLEGDVYKLSGNTGSLRYMAPEVATKQPYNNKVDVYSFGILLWQMLSLETPYEDHTAFKHNKLVVKNGVRPRLPSSWSSQISNLLKRCWHVEICERPEFSEIVEIMRDYICSKYRNNTPLVDISNKTANSLFG